MINGTSHSPNTPRDVISNECIRNVGVGTLPPLDEYLAREPCMLYMSLFIITLPYRIKDYFLI